jgi:hypothetical protein
MPYDKKTREYKASGQYVAAAMHRRKHGTLHSGSRKGPKVKSRAQAIAIGLSEQRKSGQDNAILGVTSGKVGGHAGRGFVPPYGV